MAGKRTVYLLESIALRPCVQSVLDFRIVIFSSPIIAGIDVQIHYIKDFLIYILVLDFLIIWLIDVIIVLFHEAMLVADLVVSFWNSKVLKI